MTKILMEKLPLLFILSLFFSSFHLNGAQAQEVESEQNADLLTLTQGLDPLSQSLIAEEIQSHHMEPSKVESVHYRINLNEKSVELELPNAQNLNPAEQELMVMLGVGAGLIHNLGFQAVVIRRNAQGRLTWLIQGELDYLRARFGYAPNRGSIAAGIYPFRNPFVSLAIKVGKASYSDRLSIGPELTFQKFLGASQRFAIQAKLDSPVYFGEKSALGKPYSIIPEVKLGVSIRIKSLRR